MRRLQARRGDKGFTLVELLIVIAIIGVLAAVAIPVFLSQQDKAEVAAVESDLVNAYKLSLTAAALGEHVKTGVVPANTTLDFAQAGSVTPSGDLVIVGGNSAGLMCIDGYTSAGDVFFKDAGAGGAGSCASQGIDTDSDDFSDLYEQLTGSNPNDAASTPWTDDDGDGFANIVETDAGTDTNSAASYPAATAGDTDGDGYADAVETVAGSNTGVPISTPGDVDGDETFDLGTGGGGGGGGGPATPALALSYGSTTFTTGSNSEVLSPTVENVTGTPTYSVAGTLPTGVTFDTNAGTFTGPADSAWNFQATQIAAGSAHTCAVTAPSGGVKCWGHNLDGQLGDGTTTNSSVPVDVRTSSGDATPLTGVASVTAGLSSTCALTIAGAVKCWGLNSQGQLGDGNGGVASSSPVDVVGLGSGVVAVDAGEWHTCALTDSGAVKCWGDNGYRQLGVGALTVEACYYEAFGMVNVSWGVDQATCASWGDTWGPVESPDQWSDTPVDTFNSGVSSISADRQSGCAVLTAGTAECWGGSFSTPPTAVSTAGSGLVSVSGSAAGVGTCALSSTGEVRCWTWMGPSSLTGAPTVTTVLTGAASVAMGASGSCAVLNSGGVECWGSNSWGELGTGNTTNAATPVAAFSGITVTSVAMGNGYTCVTDTDAGVSCVGYNSLGRLGNGSTTDSVTPVAVTGSGPQPGFPATVTVTVDDGSGAPASTEITLAHS